MTNLLELLRNYDTPTICNAIEVAQGKRGFAGFTKGMVVCSAPQEAPLVGFAKTAKIAGLSPPDESLEAVRERRMHYFRHMATGPCPAVAVIEDTDYPNCVAAWWGEVHSAVHKGLGMIGALTNGVMRDLDDLESGFPVIAGSVGPSHGFCHVVEIGTAVDVLELAVCEGDLVHADQHGAVVVPKDVIPDLSEAITSLLASERIILEPARHSGFDIDKLETAWAAFEKARI